MREGLIFIVSFFGGMLVSILIYSIICALVGEEDKLIVFKSKRLTKKERIEKLECGLREFDYQISYIKRSLIDINSKLERKNKK